MGPDDSAGKSSSAQLDSVYLALSRIANRLGLSFDRTQMDLAGLTTEAGAPDQQSSQWGESLRAGGRQLGIRFSELDQPSVSALLDLVAEGFPIVLMGDGVQLVLDRYEHRHFEAAYYDGSTVQYERLHWRRVRRRLRKSKELRVWVCQDELECRAMEANRLTSSKHSSHEDHKAHPSPLRRFLAMLRMDKRDLLTVFLFAFVSSLLALASPLAVESLVNVVSWAVFVQPLLILSLMLLVCLGLSGILKVLQTMLVEIIQERQLVRIVGDLSHRFPRACRDQFTSVYPRELANRVFDVMTIQKATATLLFDGISIFLNTILGMILLAVYHPFLLGFDLVLVLTMIFITLALGRGGIRTAIEESVVKYRIAHWLQDVIDFPAAFSINGGEKLAIDRANRLATEYVKARESQFRVVLRQIIFAVGLQVIASTALLSLGGWLVIQERLTLGQLVASELVVTVVVGAFAKAGKSLEIYYDLMAGIDKLGYLIDVETEPTNSDLSVETDTEVSLDWTAIEVDKGMGQHQLQPASFAQGAIVAIRDHGSGGRSAFAAAISGLESLHSGRIRLTGHDVRLWSQMSEECPIALAGRNEVFHGSLLENVSLGRHRVGRSRVREVLEQTGLWEAVGYLDEGLDTPLLTAGRPLNETQVAQLMLARSVADLPRLLVIDGLLDWLGPDSLEKVWQAIQQVASQGIVVVTTNRDDIASRCTDTIWLEKH